MFTNSRHRNPWAFLVILCGTVTLWSWGASAAGHNGYAFLTANGSDIDGEPTILTIAGEDVATAIECHSAVYELFSESGAGGVPTGHYELTPLTIRKRVDKSSPLLAKALTQNEVLEGEIRFYRADPDSGQTVRFYTLTIEGGKVSAVRAWLPDRTDSKTSNFPKLEEVSIVYSSLTLTDDISGASHVVTTPPR